jgi:diadenosine tetraphosphatase ApaH/serine/threonine PP2A family protein phosphatase
MAEVEKSHGIRSTYYFRRTPRVFHPAIMRAISAMGHEIGYHYEVLDKAQGKPRPAAEIFERELAEMRVLVEVKTAAMHGNPLSRWDNRDLWKHCALSRFGLVGEAYVSITDPDMAYVTDTGRGWNRVSLNLRDRFPSGSGGGMPSFRSTRDLIRALKEARYGKVYLQIHPNRWTSGVLEWLAQWGEDLLMNGVKGLLMWAGIRRSAK